MQISRFLDNDNNSLLGHLFFGGGGAGEKAAKEPNSTPQGPRAHARTPSQGFPASRVGVEKNAGIFDTSNPCLTASSS